MLVLCVALGVLHLSGATELWHLFVLAGTSCHFLMVLLYAN